MSNTFCPHLSKCGGCKNTQLNYEQFAQIKEQKLKKLFSKITEEKAWESFTVSKKIEPIYFRNKTRFGFVEFNNKVYPSRHSLQSSEANIPIQKCMLQSPNCNKIINYVAKYAQDHKWSIYLAKSGGIGWLKSVTVRESKKTNQFMVIISTNSDPFTNLEGFCNSITNKFPFIQSIYHSITRGKNNEFYTDQLIWGKPYIQDIIGQYTYHISPHSFFQTNCDMTPTLYDKVLSLIPEKTNTIWDLYAGSASIGIYVSSRADKIVCVENNEQNILDAKLNIAHNKLQNILLFQGSVEKICTSKFINEHFPNTIIIDPPRSGLSPKTIQLLLSIMPERIIYVSCNPYSCLKNCIELTKKTYNINSYSGVDCFPRSEHVEMVVSLLKNHK